MSPPVNSLPNNPHADIATERLGEAPAPGTADGGIAAQIHFAADAITHALLAFAFELRTANLLSDQRNMIIGVASGRGFVSDEARDYFEEREEEIQNRLGLPEES